MRRQQVISKPGRGARSQTPWLVLLMGLCLGWAWSAAASPAQAATFTPSISVGGGYDDNVNLRQNARGDFFALVRPAAALEAGRPENRLSAVGNLDYAMYSRLSEYTRVENARLGVNYHLGVSPKWTVDAANNFSASYDSVDQDETGQFSRLRTSSGRLDRNLSQLRTAYTFSPQTQVYAGYSLGVNQSTDEKVEDSLYHRGEVGGSYRFNQDWRSELKLDGQRNDYQVSDDVDKLGAEARLVRMLGPKKETFLSLVYGDVISLSEDSTRRSAREYQVYTAKLGYKAELTPQLGFEAAAGASHVQADPKFNTAAGQTYPAANLAVTYRQARWEIRGYGEYKLGEYDTLGDNSGLSAITRVGFSWLWRISPRWQLTAQADYVHDDFKQGAAPGVTGRGDVDSFRAGGLLNYQLAQYWKLGLDYRYLNRDSQVDADDRAQNRVLMLLTADWPHRW